MKKFLSRIGATALVVGALSVGLVTQARAAGRPTREAVTNVAGAASFQFPTNDSVFSSYQVEALVFGEAASSTVTVKYTVGSITQTFGTKVVSATDKVLSLTNLPTQFAGDKVLWSVPDTTSVVRSYLIYKQQ